MNNRGGNGFGSVEGKGRTDTPEVADVPVGRSADRRDLFVEREMAVEKDAEVTCGSDGLNS